MQNIDLQSTPSLNQLKKASQRFIGKFEQLCLIGTGGFSSVYKVRNKLDKKEYALKIIKVKPNEHERDLSKYLEKKLGEARMLSTLSHPNIVRYYGCWIETQDLVSSESLQYIQKEFSDDINMEAAIEQSQSSCGIAFQKQQSSLQQQTSKAIVNLNKNNVNKIISENPQKYKKINIFILTELCTTSLKHYIFERNKTAMKYFNKQNDGSVDENRDKYANQWKKIKIQNYQFILDIIKGLMYIHNQQIIHRDVKLQNIVLNNKKRCKLIDFGLGKRTKASRQLDSSSSEQVRSQDDDNNCCIEKHSRQVGTRLYSSPEQLYSNTYDHRTDIFSLAMAITLMFCCPTTAHEEIQMVQDIRNKIFDKVNIEPQLKQILIKCLDEEKNRPELITLKQCVKQLLQKELTNKSEFLSFKRQKRQKRIPLSETSLQSNRSIDQILLQ